MSEILARQLVAEYFMGGRPPDLQTGSMIERVEHQARNDVERRHAQEKQIVHHENRKELDKILENFERARGSPGAHREQFAGAAAKGETSLKTEEIVQNNPAAEPAKITHSEAFRNALERAKEEEQARQDRENHQGRTIE